MPATDSIQVRRALLSVSDKTNLIDFAQGLHDLGIQLVSTGGTFRALQDAGLPAIEVSSVTEFPEIMDGRVKTLHPKIHGEFSAAATKTWLSWQHIQSNRSILSVSTCIRSRRRLRTLTRPTKTRLKILILVARQWFVQLPRIINLSAS